MRVPREGPPARSLYVERGFGELGLQIGDRTERLFNSVGQLPVRFAPTVWTHIAPEERVQHMAGEMKGEILLQLIDGCKIVLSLASASFSRVVFAPVT